MGGRGGGGREGIPSLTSSTLEHVIVLLSGGSRCREHGNDKALFEGVGVGGRGGGRERRWRERGWEGEGVGGRGGGGREGECCNLAC